MTDRRPRGGAAAAAAAKVTDLPRDVLQHVMRLAPQATRVACMTACKALSAAALAPGTWSSVTLSNLDGSAAAFVERHRCTRVRIVTRSPDDVVWFFEHLAALGVACIEHLDVRVHSAMRLPRDFLAAIARHSTLVSLSVQVTDLVEASTIVFPRTSVLLDLETLKIREVADFDDDSAITCADDCEIFKVLSVHFGGSQSRFPSLRTLVLDVAVSDAVAGLRHMPRLEVFAYAHEDDEDTEETYEDAEFEGLCMDRMELALTASADRAHLCAQLALASVDTLVLNVHDDDMDLRPLADLDVRRLVVRVHEARAHVRVDYPNLASCRRLQHVTVELGAGWLANPQHPGFGPTLVLEGVPSVAEALERLHTTGMLSLHPLTKLVVSPV